MPKSPTNWVNAIGGLLSATTLLSNQLDSLRKTFEPLLNRLGVRHDVVMFVAAGILALTAYSFIRDKVSRRSIVRNVDILERPITRSEELYGRGRAVSRLAALTTDASMVHVKGESGVGKSTLLTVGLVPTLGKRNDTRPVYLDSLGLGDWEMSPRVALAKAVWRDLPPDERERFGVTGQIEPGAVLSVLTAIRKAGRVPIVIFDQFESYLTLHRSMLALKDDLIPWETLKARNAFWRELGDLVERDVVHLVLCVNAADRAGLQSFTLPGTEEFRIERLSKGVVVQKLDEITEASFARDPENGWNELRGRLLRDLNAEGDVLAIRVTLAIQGLQCLPHLTIGDYVRVGGLHGLEGELVFLRCMSAATLTGLDPSDVLSLLLALRIRGDRELVTLPITALLAKTKLESVDAVREALQHLERHTLVRRHRDPNTDEEQWTLYHPYLRHAVKEAESRLQPSLVRLRESFRRYREARSIWRRWLALLPPWNQLILFRDMVRRRLKGNVYRRYQALSLLRWGPYAAIPVVLVMIADAGGQFPYADAVRMRLDHWELSSFRQRYSEQEIRAGSVTMLTQLASELEARSHGEWTTTYGEPSQDADYWLHPQVIAAALRSDEAHPISSDIAIERLGRMFQKTTKDAAGVEVGWEPTRGFGYARAEPLLWTGQALALVYAKLKPNDARREQVATWIERVAAISAAYRREGGSWNRYPNQPTDQPSTYVSGLALTMLLEMRAAKYQFQIGEEKTDNLIAATTTWLMRNHDYQTQPPGWKEHPDSSTESVLEALSLYVYTVLSRTVAEMPKEFSDSLGGSLLTMLRSDFTRYVIERLGEKHDPDQSEDTPPGMEKPATVSFLWYPWAIESARRGIARASVLRWSPLQITRACQNLGRLIVEFGPGELQDAVNRRTFTFHAAEMAAVLAPLASREQPSLAQCRTRRADTTTSGETHASSE